MFIKGAKKLKTILQPVKILCGLFLLFANIQTVKAAEVLRALVYDFPPYYHITPEGTYTGLGVDLLTVMNNLQKDYQFEPTEASPRRRHTMFYQSQIDVSLFDQMVWGWDKDKVDQTQVYMGGGEKYIALRKEGVSQKLFKHLADKRIAAILGYHYNFAGFNPDPTFLNKKFDISLVSNQDQIIKMTLTNRVDIGVVTEAYLFQYVSFNPVLKDTLVVSDVYDQEYHFVGIRNKKSQIKLDELQTLIQKAVKSPEFKSILKLYGM